MIKEKYDYDLNPILLATLIINYSHDLNKPIDNLKLSKFAFFIQYDYWKMTDNLLFSSPIIKNTHGAYIPIMHDYYSQYVIDILPKSNNYKIEFLFYNSTHDIQHLVKNINLADIYLPNSLLLFIKNEVKKYIDKDIWELVHMTLDNELLKNINLYSEVKFENNRDINNYNQITKHMKFY